MLAIVLITCSLAGSAQTVEPAPKPRVELRCGAYCLFTSLNAIGLAVDTYQELEAKLGPPGRMGYSMQQLETVATTLGARTLGVATTLEHLRERPERFACIALLEEEGHFVCIYDVDDDYVYVVDPPNLERIPRNVFDVLWKGKALLISQQPLSVQTGRRFVLWNSVALALLLLFAIFIAWAIKKRLVTD